MRKYLFLSLVLCLCPMLSACLVAAAGAGGGAVYYLEGALTKNEPYTFDKTLKASREALQVMFDSKPAYEKSELTTVNKAGKKVSVKLESLTSNSTKLVIRVGTFGDKQQSQAILKAIEDRLS